MGRVMIGPCVSSRGWVWAKKKKKRGGRHHIFIQWLGPTELQNCPQYYNYKFDKQKGKSNPAYWFRLRMQIFC